MYIFFGGFEKYRILSQNPKGLAFGIIKNAFSRRNRPDNLYFIPVRPIFYVVVRCFGVVHKFLGVLKIFSFGSNPKWVRLWFYRKMYVCDEKWLEIHISSL
jgi:hypothetical protein